jgi:hypothetical protein
MQAASGGSPQLVGDRELLLACISRQGKAAAGSIAQLEKLPVPWHG